jgi:succinate dehydrogenase/fumarate reductase flavoprotein subunit
MELEAGGYVLMPNNFPLPEFFNNKEEKFPYYDACFNFIPDQKAHVIKNMDLAVAAGAEPYYGHFVEKLIFESGRVVGCYARSAESGKYVKARASKGVVLASGDYGSNEEMMEYFVPAVRAAGVFTWWPDYDVEGNPTDTGDGYKLGAWINAAIQPYHAPQIHWMGANEGSPLFESGAPEGYSAASDPVGVVGGSPYLQINLQGKRFMNEDIPGQELEFQIESQPGRQILQILDSGWKDQLAHFHPNNSNVAYALDEEPTYSASWYLNDARLERKLANGSVAQADTFEELLDYYPEFDKEEALKSIARYNELALKGKDEDFSKRSDRLFPLNKPPYYAAKGGVAPMLTSMGGLMSDKEAHVYDNDGVIIPGIYVAGNIQGSRFAFQYPMYPGTGVGHSITLYYGYVAGKNVVAGI